MNDRVDRPRRVLLCVSGGIAAYKAPELVRALVAQGIEVQVLMTRAAHAFVTEMSLAVVSKRPVRSELLDVSAEGQVGHIELATWPDLVLVAPATADLLAKAAVGLADDLVTTCLLATCAPVLWAPAMNTNMWRHAATRANLASLRERGHRFVGPDAGELACGFIGAGRMIDPPLIVDAVLESAGAGPARPLAGRRVLVSAGPTRAYIDPVRFLSNASTGAMGFALAEAAAQQGAVVTLVAGPVARATPAGVVRTDVESADELLEAMQAVLGAGPVDLVAMVAAVADLTPARRSPQKLEKHALGSAFAPGFMKAAVDVLATLTAAYRDRTFFLGFAAQTVNDADNHAVERDLIAAGARKLATKGCQALFVNRVGVPGLGFGSETNAGHLLIADGAAHPDVISSGPAMSKPALARWLLAHVQPRLAASGGE